jgi:hypothetical protein
VSATHPVVFSFGGAEHHLTFQEAQQARGRLDAAIAAATMQRDRESRATRELLEAKSREAAPPVDRSRRCTVGEAVAPGVPNTEDRGDGQQKGYVVLCDDERAKGFVRPLRHTYRHLKCGTVTTMGLKLSETYARDPAFYSGTFCCGCAAHFPVGEDGEFVWDADGSKVGT